MVKFGVMEQTHGHSICLRAKFSRPVTSPACAESESESLTSKSESESESLTSESESESLTSESESESTAVESESESKIQAY